MKKGFEHIYNVATGVEEPTAFDGRHHFTKHRCDLLFEAAYAARRSIARHMGVNFDEESTDVYRLIDAYERMMRMLGRYFYARGRCAGRRLATRYRRGRNKRR